MTTQTATQIAPRAILRALSNCCTVYDGGEGRAKPLAPILLAAAVENASKIRAASAKIAKGKDGGGLEHSLPVVLAWASAAGHSDLVAALSTSRRERGAAEIAWGIVGETGRYSARMEAAAKSVLIASVGPHATISVDADASAEAIALSLVRCATRSIGPRANGDDGTGARPARQICSIDALREALDSLALDDDDDDGEEDAATENASEPEAPTVEPEAPATGRGRAKRG